MAGKQGAKSDKAVEIPAQYGEDFMADLDGRVRVARTLRQRLKELTNDYGGPAELSYAEQSLAKRAIHVERVIEKFESTLAHGGAVEFNHLFGLVNCLSGLYTKLGLKRRPKVVGSLAEQLAQLHEEQQQESP